MSNALPVAPYLGGKRNLAKTIIKAIERVQHETYAEPFVGMGGVFFRRSTAAKCEVINDANGDVVNLFRILQRHYPQFLETVRFQITSGREFERLVATHAATLTDLERAARFLYLQRTGFGGRVTGRTFGVAAERPARFNLTTLEPMLEAAHERLAGVIIECLDVEAFIERYDRRATLFYLDPPYWGNEEDYGNGLFGQDRFSAIAAQLGAIKGKFVMSINDVPEIRALFSGFKVKPVSTTYTVSKGRGKRAAELIITN